MEHNTSDSESDFDISDSECHTIDEITKACIESGIPVTGLSTVTKKSAPSVKPPAAFWTNEQLEEQNQAQNVASPNERVRGSSKSILKESSSWNGIACEKSEEVPEIDLIDEAGHAGTPAQQYNTGNPKNKESSKRKKSFKAQDKAADDEVGSVQPDCSLKRRPKRKVHMEKRMRGESYIGYTKIVDPVTKKINTVQDNPRKERKLGPPCDSKECMKRSNRFCQIFTQEDRTNIFNEFWKDLGWEGKRSLVLSLVDQTLPSRCTVKKGDLKKHHTFMYFLKLKGIRKQVCRRLFLSTLGIGQRQVRDWLLKKPSEFRSPVSPSKRKGGSMRFANSYLKDIPKQPSHYCRKETKKLYLEKQFQSKAELYNAYMGTCSDQQEKPISESGFNNLMERKNISIHHPKKDQCDTCTSYEAGNLSVEDYDAHIERKDTARAEKSKDKLEAINGKLHVIAMDVEKVLLCPVLNASALYYKTKLNVHNFTVFNLATGHAKCFLWDETNADLVASVFASCLLSYLQENFQDNLPIVIFSDGCTSQNRNCTMSNALLHYSVKTNKVIIQKYLEKGHTQMEVDSVHSKIETKLHGREIYVPHDYVRLCESARKEHGGYEVKMMEFGDFYNFTKPCAYKSIRPGNKKSDPHVTDIRQIKYNPDETLEYKTNHGMEWSQFPRRYRVNPKTTFPKLYQRPLEIAKRKHNDLISMLHVIPEKFHDFYQNIPHKRN